MFDELERVALTHNIEDYNLKKGERGTVVEIYGGGSAYEVEFVTASGETKALLTLKSSDICLIKKSTSSHEGKSYWSSINTSTL